MLNVPRIRREIDAPQKKASMNAKIIFRPGLLQQQPRRPVNQQQQQSSGSGEFQPPRGSPPGHGSSLTRQHSGDGWRVTNPVPPKP